MGARHRAGYQLVPPFDSPSGFPRSDSAGRFTLFLAKVARAGNQILLARAVRK